MRVPLCDLPVPGEETGASCVALKGSGFGVLCLFLLSWLGLVLRDKKSSRYRGLPRLAVTVMQQACFNKGSFVFPEMCSGKRNYLKFAKYEMSCNFLVIHYFCVFPIPFFRIFIQG